MATRRPGLAVAASSCLLLIGASVVMGARDASAVPAEWIAQTMVGSIDDELFREKVQNSVGPLVELIESAPRDYGGIYIEDIPSPRVVIQVLETTTAPQRDAARDALPGFVESRFEVVPNSQAALDGVLGKLMDWTSRSDQRASDIVGFGIWGADNIVQVEAPRNQIGAVRAMTEAEFNAGLVRVVEGRGSQNTACNSRHDCWQAPTRGGLTIGSHDCTTGAVAWKAGGAIRMLSAGHCFNATGGDQWHDQNGHDFGGVQKNAYFSTSYTDFAILGLGDIQAWEGHKIYRSNDEKAWAIDAVGSAVAGTKVRLSGRTTGYGAADKVITTTYASFNESTNVWLYLQALGYYQWAGGDSGGPVFYGHTIYGIQSGCRSIPNDDDCEPWESDHSGDEGYARHQSWTGDLFDVHVCVSGLSQCTQ